jgi:hypothetical protein
LGDTEKYQFFSVFLPYGENRIAVSLCATRNRGFLQDTLENPTGVFQCVSHAAGMKNIELSLDIMYSILRLSQNFSFWENNLRSIISKELMYAGNFTVFWHDYKIENVS